MSTGLQTRQTDRRSPYGDTFLVAFARRAHHPLSFDDLVRATGPTGCRYSDVVSWIAHALSSGLIEEVGYDADASGVPRGPRRYRITPDGVQRAGHDRRRRR